jgi:hypothetical protein
MASALGVNFSYAKRELSRQSYYRIFAAITHLFIRIAQLIVRRRRDRLRLPQSRDFEMCYQVRS